MRPWFLQPFPLPFPAPSLVGFITTNVLLCSGVIALGLIFPHLRVVFGLQFFTCAPLRWLMIGTSIAGLAALYLWGTLAELLTGFVWSAIYIGALTVLRLALPSFVKTTIRDRRV